MGARSVIVTGGSRGIGRATAEALALAGWCVTLVARDSDELERARSGLAGEGHELDAMDVSDEAAWARLLDGRDQLGGLVCAAGRLEPVGPVGRYSLAEFRRTIEVNLYGTLLAIEACLPALRRARGSIVTFSGGGATKPLPRFDAYAASKAAVVRLTENIAGELAGDGVRVNCVAPGFVATEIHHATIAAGPDLAGGEYYERTRADLADGGVPASEAAELVCELLVPLGEGVFTGKLISAQWDPWRDRAFRGRLAAESELATLRRIDDVFFAAAGENARPERFVPAAPAAVAPMPASRRDVGDRAPQKLLSIVIPAYNEQDNIARVYERLGGVMDGLGLDWELIFSVDPCTDATETLIRELCDEDPRVKMLRFSRRFGQPMATIAGLEAARGDAVVVIDCDLQDPPELIPQLVASWQQGFDVVYAQRRTRAGETLPKRIVAALGYRVIKRIADVEIPANTGDFRLMSRRVIDNVVALQESHGFLRGLVGLVGFSQTSVKYDRDPRAAGTSKYNRFWGSLVIGLNGVVGFSRYPLQLISLLGVGLSGFAFALALVYLGLKLGGQNFPVGNPTIVIVVTFFSGIQLLSLGVIGEYVGRIYDESRHRPKYILESRYGWDERV